MKRKGSVYKTYNGMIKIPEIYIYVDFMGVHDLYNDHINNFIFKIRLIFYTS